MLEQDILNMLSQNSAGLGGGPGYDDARALSQLIMGGGSAQAGGTQLFGQPVNNNEAANLQLGGGNLVDVNGRPMPLSVNQTASNPAPAPVNSNLKSVLDTADQIAGSLKSPHASGNPITSTLLPNPYGAGSYNPQDPTQVAAVQKAGEEAKKADRAAQYIKLLQGEAPSISPNASTDAAQNARDLAVFQQKSKDYQTRVESSKEQVKSILESLGLSKSAEMKAFEAQFGKNAADEMFNKGNKQELSIGDASKLYKYNRDTGLFETPPPELIAKGKQAAIDAGFKIYDQKQRDAASAVAYTKGAFQQFLANKAAADQAAKESMFGKGTNLASQITSGNVGGPEGMAFNKSRVQLTSAMDQLIGGQRGAASPLLTQIRLKVLPELISGKEASDELTNQFGDLLNILSESKVNSALGVPSDYLQKKIEGKAQDVLDVFGGKRAGSSTAAGATQSHPNGEVFTLNGKQARYMNGKLQIKD